MKFGALSKAFFPDYKLPVKPVEADRNIQKIIDANNNVVRMSKEMMNNILLHYLRQKDHCEIQKIAESIVNKPRKSMLWMLTSSNIQDLYNKKLQFVDAVGDKEIFEFRDEEVKVFNNRIGTTPKTIELGIFYYLSTIKLTIAGDFDIEVQLTKDLQDSADVIETLYPATVIHGARENVITVRGNNILRRNLCTTNEHLEHLLTPSFDIARLPEQSDIISEARTIIRENIMNSEFNLSDLSSYMCVSPRTLQRKLKAAGVSFIELKNAERIEFIMKRLAMGDTKENLSHLVGYKDIGSIHKLLSKVKKND